MFAPDVRSGGEKDSFGDGDGGLMVHDFLNPVLVLRTIDLHEIDPKRNGGQLSQIVQDCPDEGFSFAGIEGGASTAVEVAAARFHLDKNEERALSGARRLHDKIDFIAQDANAATDGAISVLDKEALGLPFAPNPLFLGLAFGGRRRGSRFRTRMGEEFPEEAKEHLYVQRWGGAGEMGR